MSDLISRKRLLELANKEGAYGYVDAKQILEAPTAYDPDKVVEGLEEKSVTYCREYGYAEDENVLYLPDAIEIVKKGGV